MADLRRITDLKFFHDNYSGLVTSVRISASQETRVQRGFIPTPGIDDAESECGLDCVTDWDVVINNNGVSSQLQCDIELLTKICRGAL